MRIPGSRVIVAIMFAALALGFPGNVLAQAVKGGLLGNVSHTSGLAVPGATVTITETRTNLSYNTTNNQRERLLHLLEPHRRRVPGRRGTVWTQKGDA